MNLRLLLLGALLILASSCTRDESLEIPVSSYTINVKASLEDDSYLWSSSDRVSLFVDGLVENKELSILSGVGSTVATFSGPLLLTDEVAQREGYIYTLYPYDEDAISNGSLILVKLSNTQTQQGLTDTSGSVIAIGRSNQAVAAGSSETTEIDMYNVASVIELELDTSAIPDESQLKSLSIVSTEIMPTRIYAGLISAGDTTLSFAEPNDADGYGYTNTINIEFTDTEINPISMSRSASGTTKVQFMMLPQTIVADTEWKVNITVEDDQQSEFSYSATQTFTQSYVIDSESTAEPILFDDQFIDSSILDDTFEIGVETILFGDNPDEMIFPNVGADFSEVITVTAGGDWSITYDGEIPSWLTISATSGGIGRSDVTFSRVENQEGSFDVKFSLDDNTDIFKELKITSQADASELSIEDVESGDNGQLFRLYAEVITIGGDYTIIADESGVMSIDRAFDAVVGTTYAFVGEKGSAYGLSILSSDTVLYDYNEGDLELGDVEADESVDFSSYLTEPGYIKAKFTAELQDSEGTLVAVTDDGTTIDLSSSYKVSDFTSYLDANAEITAWLVGVDDDVIKTVDVTVETLTEVTPTFKLTDDPIPTIFNFYDYANDAKIISYETTDTTTKYFIYISLTGDGEENFSVVDNGYGEITVTPLVSDVSYKATLELYLSDSANEVKIESYIIDLNYECYESGGELADDLVDGGSI